MTYDINMPMNEINAQMNKEARRCTRGAKGIQIFVKKYAVKNGHKGYAPAFKQLFQECNDRGVTVAKMVNFDWDYIVEGEHDQRKEFAKYEKVMGQK